MARTAARSICAPSASATATVSSWQRDEPRAPLRIRLHGAHGRAERGRRERDRREEGELVPQERLLVGRERDLESGRAQLVHELGQPRPRREVDASERRPLAHEPGLDPLRLDPDRSREDVRVPLPQQGNVVDPVQERHDDRLAHALRRRERERRLELRRLRRHPEDVDLAVELAGRLHVDLEVSENDALDAQPAGMPRQRLGPEQEDDVRARTGERGADETPHAARAEDRVTHCGRADLAAYGHFSTG